tara:strand:+ start:1449 stop:1988 length:540 start_codon:yes stop_codon:yes gene_type:complete
MEEDEITTWTNQSNTKSILISFSSPKTPTQVQRELGIKKFNLKPFLKRKLLSCLCPGNSKGRLYVTTNKAKRILGLPIQPSGINQNAKLIGWIFASPRQRLVVLKTMNRYSRKMTSEQIRIRSGKLNPCLSRISTKSILKELIQKGLVETEMGDDRRRYYWLSEFGNETMASDVFPIRN